MKIFFAFFFSFLLLNHVSAQALKLHGKIVDVDNIPVMGAKITLKNTAFSTSSDSLGTFELAGIYAKTYELSITKEGFKEFSEKITLKNTSTTVNIILHSNMHHLNEVIVTGNRNEKRKEEESLNIEIVNSDFIQRNLGGSLMKTLERIPGIKTIGIGSGQSKPLIRGMGFNRVVVVDKGIKHEGQQWGADHGLEIDQFAVGEVELIKGAASFIYGSDAIGGVIDIKPKQVPGQNTMGGSIDLIGKTNNNLYGTSVNLYGRNQRWFFDTRFTYQNYGDYRVPTDTVYIYDFAVRLNKNHLRNTAGRETGFHFNTGYIGENFRSIFYLSNTFSNSGFFANAHGLEPRQVNTELHDASSRDILMPSQKVNHFKLINRSSYNIGIHSLEMELGYQRNFRQEFSQYVNHGYMPPIYPDTLPIPKELEREYDKHVFSANFRDQIDFGKHTLTVGLNGEHQNNAINGWTFLVPGFRQTIAGVFAYDKFKLTDQWLLHTAIRYDYGHVRMFKYTDWFPSQVAENGAVVSKYEVRAEDRTRTYNSFVWSLGVNYNPEKFSLKANIGKSFRMPIVKETGANGVNYHYFSYELGDPNLSPEQSYQADLTLGWRENNWSIQFSPFYNYFPNYIYLNPTPYHSDGPGAGNQIFEYSQSRVKRYGGEFQFKWNFYKNLSTELLAEYLHAEQLSGNKKGYTLPFSPPTTGLINLTWSPEIKKLDNSYISLDYRVTAAQNNIVPPEKKTPGYQLVNLQAGTTLPFYKQPIMVSLQVQNVLDTRYLNHTSFYRLIELPETGRNIILSLKVPFRTSR